MKNPLVSRRYAFLVGMLLLSALAWSDALSLDAPNLSLYADTESTTNVVFCAGDSDDRIFRLSLELNATADNNVSVVFTGALAASMFNPGWNLMQVTARGFTESGGIVVNQVLGRGLKVILR